MLHYRHACWAMPQLSAFKSPKYPPNCVFLAQLQHQARLPSAAMLQAHYDADMSRSQVQTSRTVEARAAGAGRTLSGDGSQLLARRGDAHATVQVREERGGSVGEGVMHVIRAPGSIRAGVLLVRAAHGRQLNVFWRQFIHLVHETMIS